MSNRAISSRRSSIEPMISAASMVFIRSIGIISGVKPTPTCCWLIRITLHRSVSRRSLRTGLLVDRICRPLSLSLSLSLFQLGVRLFTQFLSEIVGRKRNRPLVLSVPSATSRLTELEAGMFFYCISCSSTDTTRFVLSGKWPKTSTSCSHRFNPCGLPKR